MSSKIVGKIRGIIFIKFSFVSATCGVADAFLPDTCVTCGTRFYTCNGAGAGTESFCTGALVWSQTLMSCVPANICT